MNPGRRQTRAQFLRDFHEVSICLHPPCGPADGALVAPRLPAAVGRRDGERARQSSEPVSRASLAVRVLHASAFEMGVLTASATAAFLVVGLPTGVWVDRLPYRGVMIVADLGGLAVGSIPVAYALGSLGLVQLYVVSLTAGVLTVFFDVAYQSYLPGLVGLQSVTEGNAKLMGSAKLLRWRGRPWPAGWSRPSAVPSPSWPTPSASAARLWPSASSGPVMHRRGHGAHGGAWVCATRSPRGCDSSGIARHCGPSGHDGHRQPVHGHDHGHRDPLPRPRRPR